MNPDAQIFLLPMVAGLLVLATHVPLGQEVLRRGIIFIDIAVAQFAVTGVIAAQVLGDADSGIVVQLAAVSAAVSGALVLEFTEKHWPQLQEALIGVAFVSVASLGLLLLSASPHGSEQLHDLLAGQVLWVGREQVLWVTGLYAGILALWALRPGLATGIGFYPVFALAVTASVQMVGVYLVFASLIIPALGTRSLAGPRRLAAGLAIGAGGYALGLLASALGDFPAGPAIVLSMLGISLAVTCVRAARRATVD